MCFYGEIITFSTGLYLVMLSRVHSEMSSTTTTKQSIGEMRRLIYHVFWVRCTSLVPIDHYIKVVSSDHQEVIPHPKL